MKLRFTPEAAQAYRQAIVEAAGVEVFAIGDVDRGVVVEVTIAARGRVDQVPAVMSRMRPGQVAIHNHPSGDLRPSEPDLMIAGRLGEEGVGFVIVDSEVKRSTWVVEPWTKARAGLAPEKVEAVFRDALPVAIPGWESRDTQVEMALMVSDALSGGHPLVVEAGTGTGKSLAYLIPAALWALENDEKVVVSTHTKALQAQLRSSDLPQLAKSGIELKTAVLEGRNNYLCKRRLGLALEDEDATDDEQAALRDLAAWEKTSQTGSRSDLPIALEPGVWERVESDTDLSLRVRCPHYQTCHFYAARRAAAAAHLVVVNHALLLADLALRADIGRGLLPRYDRLVLDEAHHIEQAATGATAARTTSVAIRRAVAILMPSKRGRQRGSLQRLTQAVDATDLDDGTKVLVRRAAVDAAAMLPALRQVADQVLEGLANALDPKHPTRRIRPPWTGTDEFLRLVRDPLEHLSEALAKTTAQLDAIHDALGDARLPDDKAQALLDVSRTRNRLGRHADVIRSFLDDESPGSCRWLELIHRRNGAPTVAVRVAPVEVAETLRRVLWDPLPGTICTSATLSVGGTFGFWRARTGLESSEEGLYASPFNHFEQALLGLPRDLPAPDSPGWLEASSKAIVDAIEISGGGVFVLCTSWRAVRAYAVAVRAALPGRRILVQGELARPTLLDRFRRDQDAVLIGTDSFWEGVSVKGRALRMVIIPRLPFRVPTDPLRQARAERIEAGGGNPFNAYTLPEAVIKLRQGYGRLIRSRSDRGVVLLLDRRLHERNYGRVILQSLPTARRIGGPWAQVKDVLRQFYASGPA